MGFIDLTAINTYKRGKKTKNKNRFSYKLTEITVVKKKKKKNMAEKIHSTVFFTFFVSKSAHLFQRTREGNTETRDYKN